VVKIPEIKHEIHEGYPSGLKFELKINEFIGNAAKNKEKTGAPDLASCFLSSA
jgi:hypothetical protein